MTKPLINKKHLLEKYPGKGGWTYTLVYGIPATLRAKGGMVRVKGFVDDFEINGYNLFPLKDKPTTYFFPVKGEIRKKIKKEADDYVHIILYPDNAPLHIPDEIILCLEDEPKALSFFKSLNESEQHNYIKWIYAAKTEQTKIDRMANAIDMLKERKKYNALVKPSKR